MRSDPVFLMRHQRIEKKQHSGVGPVFAKVVLHPHPCRSQAFYAATTLAPGAAFFQAPPGHGHAPRSWSDLITLKNELTKDPVLLEQYYRIREKCFRRELGIADFYGSEDARDRRSDILVARVGGRCIGGTRITGRHPQSLHPCRAPRTPKKDWIVAALPGLRLAENSFCQWVRLAGARKYRTPEVLRHYCSAMIEASRALGYA